MRITIFPLLFILISCLKDNGIHYPVEIHHHVEIFHQEASLRANISYNGLKIITGTNFKYSAFYDPNTHTIFIDTASLIWKQLPEETMAHEMGHALLRRQHDFTRLPDGRYKSVMGNYSHPAYGGWTLHDTIRYRKKYYYDELFNLQ